MRILRTLLYQGSTLGYVVLLSNYRGDSLTKAMTVQEVINLARSWYGEEIENAKIVRKSVICGYTEYLIGKGKSLQSSDLTFYGSPELILTTFDCTPQLYQLLLSQRKA